MVEIEHLFDQGAIQKIRDLLLSAHKTIAVAESVTAGLLQAAAASAPDASLYFQGGITAYNIGQKYKHLTVEPIHANTCNCVSEKVAAEMAANVCGLFNSDYGIGITGYAAPVPESGNRLFAYFAVAAAGQLVVQGRLDPPAAAPLRVQLFYVNQVLQQLKSYLLHG